MKTLIDKYGNNTKNIRSIFNYMKESKLLNKKLINYTKSRLMTSIHTSLSELLFSKIYKLFEESPRTSNKTCCDDKYNNLKLKYQSLLQHLSKYRPEEETLAFIKSNQSNELFSLLNEIVN